MCSRGSLGAPAIGPVRAGRGRRGSGSRKKQRREARSPVAILPPQARGGRSQGRRSAPRHARGRRRKTERAAHRLASARGRASLTVARDHRAARLSHHGVRGRPEKAAASCAPRCPRFPPARARHRRGSRLQSSTSGRRLSRRTNASNPCAPLAGPGLRRDLRRPPARRRGTRPSTLPGPARSCRGRSHVGIDWPLLGLLRPRDESRGRARDRARRRATTAMDCCRSARRLGGDEVKVDRCARATTR